MSVIHIVHVFKNRVPFLAFEMATIDGGMWLRSSVVANHHPKMLRSCIIHVSKSEFTIRIQNSLNQHHDETPGIS